MAAMQAASIRSGESSEMCSSIMVFLEVCCVGCSWCWMDAELGSRQERKHRKEGDQEETACRCGFIEQVESIPSKGWVTTDPIISVCSSEVLSSAGNHARVTLHM